MSTTIDAENRKSKLAGESTDFSCAVARCCGMKQIGSDMWKMQIFWFPIGSNLDGFADNQLQNLFFMTTRGPLSSTQFVYLAIGIPGSPDVLGSRFFAYKIGSSKRIV
jgi:hypothetical protein